MESPDVDTVLEHLREIAAAKRGLLQVAVAIAEDFPSEAHTLLSMIHGLTRSADKLLGDTVVV